MSILYFLSEFTGEMINMILINASGIGALLYLFREWLNSRRG